MNTNPGCATCDYFNQCRRTLVVDGTRYLAKEQTSIRMKCINKVQMICRDCFLFYERRCASWKVLNGKEKGRGNLQSCPKKEVK